MPATADASALRLASIDDYLGPSGSRFFGSGYRRVRYRIRDIVTDDTERCPRWIRAKAGVFYPPDWSTKSAGVTLRPHLSTIDALILAVRMSEFALIEAYDLTEQQRRTAWLRRVDIKAGSAPVEDDLDELIVETSWPKASSGSDSSDAYVSSFDCRIGNMKVRCEIQHAIGTSKSPDEPVGSGDLELYGEGYRHRQQCIKDITADMRSQRAEAVATVKHIEEAEAPSGVLGSVSIIDGFVISLQMGQMLLYELDAVQRTQSNTLWMRQTMITTATPSRSFTSAFAVKTELTDSRILEARDRVWRAATIVGNCQGVHVRCDVAHQLPALHGRLAAAS